MDTSIEIFQISKSSSYRKFIYSISTHGTGKCGIPDRYATPLLLKNLIWDLSFLSTIHIVLSTLLHLQTLVCVQTDCLQFILTFLCETNFLDMIFFTAILWILSTWFISCLKSSVQNLERVFTNSQNNQTITSRISQATRFIHSTCLLFTKYHYCFGKTVDWWLGVC